VEKADEGDSRDDDDDDEDRKDSNISKCNVFVSVFGKPLLFV
jgi:hypothetical protein